MRSVFTDNFELFFLMVSDHGLKDGFCAILWTKSIVFSFWFADLCTFYTVQVYDLYLQACVWQHHSHNLKCSGGGDEVLLFSQKFKLFFDFSEMEIITFSSRVPGWGSTSSMEFISKSSWGFATYFAPLVEVDFRFRNLGTKYEVAKNKAIYNTENLSF